MAWCRGVTSKGKRCKLQAMKGMRYCRYHLPIGQRYDWEFVQRLLQQKEVAKVDFKLELHTKTKEEKAEFIKDMIAFANAPGREGYLLIGVDPETEVPTKPPNRKITEEHLQQIVSRYCKPFIEIEYERVMSGGKVVGLLIVHRDAKDLAYRVRKSVGKIVQDDVFIRHGRHSEKPTYDELQSLIIEGYLTREGKAAVRKARPSEAYAYLSDEQRLTGMKGELRRALRRERVKYRSCGAQIIAHTLVQGTPVSALFHVVADNLTKDRHIELLRWERSGVEVGRARTQIAKEGASALVVALVYGTVRKTSVPSSYNYYYEVIPQPFGLHLRVKDRKEDGYSDRLYLKNVSSPEDIAKVPSFLKDWLNQHPEILVPAGEKWCSSPGWW